MGIKFQCDCFYFWSNQKHKITHSFYNESSLYKLSTKCERQDYAKNEKVKREFTRTASSIFFSAYLNRYLFWWWFVNAVILIDAVINIRCILENFAYIAFIVMYLRAIFLYMYINTYLSKYFKYRAPSQIRTP